VSRWIRPPSLGELNAWSAGNAQALCGIVFTELGDDFLRGIMPVTKSLTQPFGLLHGGVSVVLAETLGSTAAYCAIDRDRFVAVGQEVNANHLQAAYAGDVITGTARAIHVGTRSHVWGVELRDQRGRLVCVSRLTMAVIPRRPAQPAPAAEPARPPAGGPA
jgi:1,4-dihydroxy-2-naphthoyl-CoA hydrolase